MLFTALSFWQRAFCFCACSGNVKKGDMIAEIDSTTQQNEVDSTKAKLKSYQAQLTAAQITEKVAQQQYDRTKKLAEQKAASAEDLENAEDVLATAKSRVTELESTIKETEIALSTAETNLGYTRITATLDGTVVSVPVKVGQTINAAMNTPTIVQVADLSKMEILIEISEGDVTVRVEEAEGTDLLSGEIRNLNDIYLPPFTVKFFKKNN